MIAPVATRRFVGRDAELAQLHELRRAAARGRPSMALVGGEAGMGKSRLLWEFTRSLTGGRAPLLAQSECLERASRPLGPIRTIISAIATSAPSLAVTVSPLARRVLEQLLPYAGADSRADAEALDKEDLFVGIHEIFATIAQKRASVLTIEDLHWADSATLEVLEYLAQRLTTMRLFFVITLRDDVLASESPLACTLGRLEREQTVHLVSLQPLGQPALHALLESSLNGRTSLTSEGLREIEVLSDGNPLWAQELLKNRLAGGSRRRVLPRSIQTLVSERVAQLGRRGRRVLMHAAVLGERFDASTLALVLGCAVDRLSPALQHASELDLVMEESGSSLRFRFRHALTREALYQSQLALSLRPLH
ncbi:MAG: AAA family ATPase, partial [Candidatus Eremiobacteraeota bacterium]|nr:AAA family ATPase [Candidatus Eremiobacteraeota bacterium]